MKVCLLYPDRETSLDPPYSFKSDIAKDLNFSYIYNCISKGDTFIQTVASAVMMNPLKSKETILYRQEMLQDVLKNATHFERLYHLLTEMGIEIGNYRTEELYSRKSGSATLKSTIFQTLDLLKKLIDCLEALKDYIDTTETLYESSSMKKFCREFKQEYNPEFMQKLHLVVQDMIRLKEGGTLRVSAVPGLGMRAEEIMIHDIREGSKPPKVSYINSVKEWYVKRYKKNVILLDTVDYVSGYKQFTGVARHDNDKEDYTSLLHDARKLEHAGLSYVLSFYQGFTDELSAYFEQLRYQVAFYIGCHHLHTRLSELSIPLCFPTIPEPSQSTICFEGLYDLSLALISMSVPVTNDINKLDKKLLIISGANQGGKSTFLRSFATVQVMMLAGIFVPATSYRCSLCGNIFTHFTRREDASMNSGRLDEELKRMSAIIKEVKPGDMVFLNESFATTTEKEGSLIAFDIAKALYESDIKLMMVTHLYEFIQKAYQVNPEHATFLSAERTEDGRRTFKMLEMPPSQTSYGMDLYVEIMKA